MSIYIHLVSSWLHVNHVIVSREFSPRFCPRKWRLKHFYWHRIIADEFHELIGAAVDGHHPFNEAKHQLTQLEAESRWGLNLGTYIIHQYTSLWSWECAMFQDVFCGAGGMPGHAMSRIFQITFLYPLIYSHVCPCCWGPFVSRTSTPPFQTVAEIAVTATFFHRKIERTKDACVRFITEMVRQNKNVAKQLS